MLFPIAVDVPMARWPWMNWVLMSIIGLCFLLQQGAPEMMEPYILGISDTYTAASESDDPLVVALLEAIGPLEAPEESPASWIVHMFLHADLVHLLGNLLFLWVFGNAVCAKIGNLWFLLAFLGSGLLAALLQQAMVTGPALGASGAINGVIGLFLIFYPLNTITMFYWFFWRAGTFVLSSYWMILLWFGFDVLGALSGAGGVGYFAHLGGFAAGALAGLALHRMHWIAPTQHERFLTEVLTHRRTGARRSTERERRPGRGKGARELFVRVQDQTVRMSAETVAHLHRSGRIDDATLISDDGHEWVSYVFWVGANR